MKVAAKPRGSTAARRSPTHRWRNENPLLSVAYKEAKRRFGSLPNVRGIGMGRKFQETKGRYAPAERDPGGLCIHVFVDQKVPLVEIPIAERIPKYLDVLDPSSGAHGRVKFDVMTVGSPRLQATPYRHDWPSAGVINVGRLFTFGWEQARAEQGTFEGRDASLGTVGAMITIDDVKGLRRGSVFAISAGHVFANPCDPVVSAPVGDRCVGVSGSAWDRLSAGCLIPETLEDFGQFRDGMCMAVRAIHRPTRTSWPHNFDRTFASDEDIRAAIASDSERGFVWVDRDDAPLEALSIDVMSGVDGFSAPICQQGVVPYQFVWKYRFLGESSVSGDSGAGVFIQTVDGGKWRLLGFHVMFDEETRFGYAIDARQYLAWVFGGALGKNYSFA